MSLNKVMLIGHLGQDPEVTYTQGGVAIAKFSIATTEKWNDKNTGEKKEKTEWHRIKVFDKRAENAGRYLSKGKQVYIEGKIQYYQYEKDGNTMYGTDILAEKIQFLGGGNQRTDLPLNENQSTPQQGFSQQGFGQQQGYNQPPVNQNQQQGSGFSAGQPNNGQANQQQDAFNDDIPF